MRVFVTISLDQELLEFDHDTAQEKIGFSFDLFFYTHLVILDDILLVWYLTFMNFPKMTEKIERIKYFPLIYVYNPRFYIFFKDVSQTIDH